MARAGALSHDPPIPRHVSAGPAGSTCGDGSRKKAIDWYLPNVPLPHLVIEAEVNRCVPFPGQALYSMVGRLDLKCLRSDTACGLGYRFDVRTSHDAVVRSGPLRLAATNGVVDRWIVRASGSER